MDAPQRACRVRVEGRVQRLGYRRLVLDTAQEFRIAGYVKNEKDGSVMVFAQGEEPQLNQFLERIRAPPPPTSIRGFAEETAKPNPKIKFFEIRFGSIAEELQEGFGAMEKEFRNYREEFRGFAERTDQSFKALEGMYGEISAKLTKVLETLQRESMETRKELTRAVDTLAELVRQFIGKTTKA